MECPELTGRRVGLELILRRLLIALQIRALGTDFVCTIRSTWRRGRYDIACLEDQPTDALQEWLFPTFSSGMVSAMESIENRTEHTYT